MTKSYETLKSFYSHEDSILKGEKGEGTVYTPDWVAKNMVYMMIKNQVDNAFRNESVLFDVVFKEGFMAGKKFDKTTSAFSVLLEALLKMKILDLSMGSGVLLMVYTEFITYLLDLCSGGDNDQLVYFIENNLYGVDIHEDAVRNAKRWFQNYAIYKGCAMPGLNFTVANSLIDALPFEKASFDFVIGNPPYIGEKNNLKWFEPIKNSPFGRWTYEGKMDYFYFFVYKGWEYLKQEGNLCYLTSNYFLTADGARQLRSFIKAQFNFASYLDYGDLRIFPEKKLHASAYVLKKESVELVSYYNQELKLLADINPENIYRPDGSFVFINDEAVVDQLTRLSQNSIGPLEQFYHVHQGLVSGCDKAFVFQKEEAEALPEVLKNILVPLYKNSDIKHFWTENDTPLRLLYVDANSVQNDELRHALERLLEPHHSRLTTRREVIKQVRAWYELTWPRDRRIFESPKIVAPQRAKTNYFAYTEHAFYASADVYYITEKSESGPYSLPILSLMLNSSLYQIWLKNFGKKKGNLLELYATPLKNLPILRLSPEEIDVLSEIVKRVNQRQASSESFISLIDQVIEHNLNRT